MKKNHRFWSFTTNEQREILNMTTNEYGDFVFTLDGGEIWQFTPHQDKQIDVLEIDRIEGLGRGHDSKTGAPSPMSFLVLKNPKKTYTGNIRVLPRPPIETPPNSTDKPPAKRKTVIRKEAARLCGVSVSTIRGWDRGEHMPDGYTGRDDAVLLAAWAGRREEGARMKKAVLRASRHGNMDDVSHKVERGGRW